MYFFFVLVDRQKQEVVTQTAKEVGHRKKEDPAHRLPTITNQSPLPKKLRQRCRPLPMWRSKDGVVKEKKKEKDKQQNINIKVPHSPLHTEMREVCRHKY